jgi:hypothetical protein
MTYKRACGIAALLGIPSLILDLMVRMPPFYHMHGAHQLAQVLLFPGWQLARWLTGDVMGRTLEYKLLLPLLVVVLNVVAWGGVIWWVANLRAMIEHRRS